MNSYGFIKLELPPTAPNFNDLLTSVQFEVTGKGRLGNHIVKVNNNQIPLVRTTTKYKTAAFEFNSAHDTIVSLINEAIKSVNNNHIEGSLHFNNALIEVYDYQYRKMKFHSDMAIDLAADSYIALFSCYENPDELNELFTRTLVIKNKTTEEEQEIPLTHHSVILFSVATNSQYSHKIIVNHTHQKKPTTPDNRWSGITFRTSKTIVQFKDNGMYFENGTPLHMANETEQREFFMLRGQENRSLDFTYPSLAYTLSDSDLLQPLKANETKI